MPWKVLAFAAKVHWSHSGGQLPVMKNVVWSVQSVRNFKSPPDHLPERNC